MIGIAAIYLWLPTKNYYWDGISFAASIESSSGLSVSLIHPHHLLYNVFGYGLYNLTQLVGANLRAVQVLQISNSILSAACAWLLFRILRHTSRSIYLSTLLTLTFSFSATWWKYSTDANAYVPSLLFLLICFNLLLQEKTRPASLALAHSASMCLHQLAVFFYPVVVIGMLARPGSFSLRQRMRWILEYSFVASTITLVANFYCFYLHTGSSQPAAFFRWLTSYVQGPESYSFSFDVLSNLRYTLRAQVRLFFEGRLNWIQGIVSFPLILLIAILILLVLILVWRSFRALPGVHRQLRFVPDVADQFKPLVYVSLAWLSIYVAFLFFWYPYFTPYRIFSLPPLICLGGVLLTQKELLVSQRRRANAAMMVAVMAISNFVFFIFPLSHADKYPPLSFALKMQEQWSKNAVIYYAKSNADNQLIRYINPTTDWRNLDRGLQVDSLERQIEVFFRNGATVWFETSAIDEINSTTEGKAWLSVHTRIDSSQKLMNRSYRIEFVQIFPKAKTAQARLLAAANFHANTFQ